MMNRRDDLRKRDPTSPELPRLNKAIQNRICVHKRKKLRDFVETMDQKTDLTKLWRTIKRIDGRAKREAENEAITFNGISFSSSKQLATKFNQQFKWICYPDDITVWASGVKIPELEHKINDYLTEMSCFLLISAPKSTETLFTPDPKQANTHPKIKISDAELPLVRNPKLLGGYLDTFFSFNTHCVQVANRVSKRNNVLKALAGTN